MPRIIYNSQPYRIPYMGGKQRIAYPLLQKLNEVQPSAKYFIDLFGGGGSVSLYALQCGYNVIYNELDKPLYYLFNFLIQNTSQKTHYFEKFYKISKKSLQFYFILRLI